MFRCRVVKRVGRGHIVKGRRRLDGLDEQSRRRTLVCVVESMVIRGLLPACAEAIKRYGLLGFLVCGCGRKCNDLYITSHSRPQVRLCCHPLKARRSAKQGVVTLFA
jgi:hypothetical protein